VVEAAFPGPIEDLKIEFVILGIGIFVICDINEKSVFSN